MNDAPQHGAGTVAGTVELARAVQRELTLLAESAEQRQEQVVRLFGSVEAHRAAGDPLTWQCAAELEAATDQILDLMGRIQTACDPYTAWAAGGAASVLAQEPDFAAPDAIVFIEVEGAAGADHFGLVNSVADAMVGIDDDARITAWNDAAERLLGWSRAEAIGQSISIIVPETGLEDFQTRCDRAYRGHPEEFETVRQHRDGSLVSVHVTPSTVFTSSGEVVGALATYRPHRRRTDAG